MPALTPLTVNPQSSGLKTLSASLLRLPDPLLRVKFGILMLAGQVLPFGSCGNGGSGWLMTCWASEFARAAAA